MIVTDKEYFMDKKLAEKIDLMCRRCSGSNKMDNVVILDGDEGTGKTTLAVELAYYAAYKLKRPFSLDNIFFDAEKLLNFAKSTEDQIILWDEAAFEGLAADWRNKAQRNLIKMLMVARKKRHFYFFCIPKFFKLNEYIVIDRSIALVHVYARNEIQLGRFTYYKKRTKEKLYYEWRKSHKRSYKRMRDLWGSFPNALGKIIDEEEYDKRKDEAIYTLLEEDKTKKELKMLRLQYKVAIMDGLSVKEKAKHFQVSERTIYDWAKNAEKHPEILENEEK